MELSKLFFEFIDVKRDIYQNARLFQQNRRVPEAYQNEMFNNTQYQNVDNVADFIVDNISDEVLWKKQNEKFLKYHKSLNPHTFFNSIPIDHYIGLKTDLSHIKEQVVIDVGGGTGHFLSSFFRYPQSLHYFLVDPNVRLLHDQFIRMYPELLEIPIGHVRSYAEELPFKDSIADLIISSSAIDHYKDYALFIKEAYRCLKPGGKLLISSHLEGARSSSSSSFGVTSMLEKSTRLIHRIRNRVALDDHVEEFQSTEPIKNELLKTGFSVSHEEEFKQYFYLLAIK